MRRGGYREWSWTFLWSTLIADSSSTPSSIGGGLTSGSAGSESYVSSNMYQLNAYLSQLARDARKRKAAGEQPAHLYDERAEGMLYATVGDRDFVHHYRMEPHRFSIATVNLDHIGRQLKGACGTLFSVDNCLTAGGRCGGGRRSGGRRRPRRRGRCCA